MSTDFAVNGTSVPGLDDLESSSWHHFLEAGSLFIEILNRELLVAHELGLSDVRLLELLDRADGRRVRMGDVAEALTLQPSRLTALVRRLESSGLVLRHTDNRDRRGVVVSVTATGRARLAAALHTYAHLVRNHYLDQLTRQQMTALGESSRRITEEMSKSDRTGP